MLKVLLKKQFTEMFSSYFYDPKKNKARSKASTIGYIVLFVFIMVGVLGGMFTALSISICRPLSQAGVSWMYFTLTGLIAIALGTFGSVFNTYTGLYLSKDNDLLLSLPIPVNALMTSRLLGVYLMGLMYSAVVTVPAVVVYFVVCTVSAAGVLGCLLFVALISVFVLTLSCALGWVVAKVSLKLKNKSFIAVLASLVFIGLYYFVYYKAQSMIQTLVENAAVYGEKIKGGAYPLYLFGRVGTGDPTAIVVVSAVVLVLFGLMWFILSRSFLKIATASSASAKRVYKEKAAKRGGVDAALFKKELGRFISSPNYMLNCGFGVLLVPVGGVAMLLKGRVFSEILLENFGELTDIVPAVLFTAICAMCSMNNMAAPSVSLEGKSLWLAQSLPVTAWQVLRAKLFLQLVLTAVPALFAAVCVFAVYGLGALQMTVFVLAMLLFVLFSGLVCLFFGVKTPNLTWTNEVVPIKQSLGVFLAMFGGFIYSALMFGGYFLVGYHIGFSLYFGALSALTLALSLLLLLWLKKKGTEIFETL